MTGLLTQQVPVWQAVVGVVVGNAIWDLAACVWRRSR